MALLTARMWPRNTSLPFHTQPVQIHGTILYRPFFVHIQNVRSHRDNDLGQFNRVIDGLMARMRLPWAAGRLGGGLG